MFPLVQEIWSAREDFFEEAHPLVAQHHRDMSNHVERVTCEYQADGDPDTYLQMSRENLAHDKHLGRTSRGPHRDRLMLQIEGQDAKQYGSQGQRKSLVLALKLTQFEYLAGKMGKKPVLLLDDIFDRLDPSRAQQLINTVLGPTFGQVFITDTQEAPVAALLGDQSYDSFKIKKHIEIDEEE